MNTPYNHQRATAENLLLRICIPAILVFSIAGCASSHDKLEAYVGMDIQEVVSEFGNPDVAFDMGDGRRDFMWTTKQSSSMPAYDISLAALTSPVEQFDPEIKAKPLIPGFGGKPIAAECSYIMITHWDEAKKTWTVSAYQEPKSGC